MSRKCEKCLFYDVCDAKRVCEHFATIEDSLDIDAIIEPQRKEYYEAWLKYIEDRQG